jgi:hypothetical protein
LLQVTILIDMALLIMLLIYYIEMLYEVGVEGYLPHRLPSHFLGCIRFRILLCNRIFRSGRLLGFTARASRMFGTDTTPVTRIIFEGFSPSLENMIRIIGHCR